VCVLARTNECDASTTPPRIAVPTALSEHAWAGRSLAIRGVEPPAFELAEQTDARTVLDGRVYRSVAMPRVRGASGKARNVFDPGALMRRGPELARALEAIAPGLERELLSFPLCPGRWSHEYEPLDQARIGGGASWVHGVARRACGRCAEPLRFALQVPGALLGPGSDADAVHYVLSCARHPDELPVVVQRT